MIWHRHTAFTGLHSTHMSASKHHWLNYDDDKFDRVYHMQQEAKRGTELHAFAAEAIRLKIPLKGQTTLALYVNHAIGFRMRPEQLLMYNANAFGTPDAIGFRKDVLRVHDLKNGTALTSWKQLDCYCALFCLEYLINPFKIKMICRIYQSDEYREHIPDADDIMHIMERYKYLSKRVDDLRQEEDDW